MHRCEIMTLSVHTLVVRMTRVIRWMILTVPYVYWLALVYAIVLCAKEMSRPWKLMANTFTFYLQIQD